MRGYLKGSNRSVSKGGAFDHVRFYMPLRWQFCVWVGTRQDRIARIGLDANRHLTFASAARDRACCSQMMRRTARIGVRAQR